MKISICRRLIRRVTTALISLMTLFGAASLVPAYAGVHPNLNSEYCMADAYLLEPGNKLAQDALNCTANDVEITQVTPVNAAEECTLGDIFTFEAVVKVQTNANERWDTTFYLPLTENSPQVVHVPSTENLLIGDDCSIILPNANDLTGEPADVKLDSDVCGDITKANGTDNYEQVVLITMLCSDVDNDNRADFSYCAAWDNIERDNCSLGGEYPGQIPNNKSKCNCDTFNIDVFITPEPPVVIKTLVSTNTHAEPGGVYTFDVDFDNPNNKTSIFLTSLVDEVDIVDPSDPGSYNVALDLWGTPVTAGSSDGVYLTDTNCDALLSGGQIEIVPSGSFGCQFEVTIVDSDLPNDQSPELYDDTIRLSLEDKNGDDVTNGETCPADLAGTAGKFCSNVLQVQVTNLLPSITVLKTADPIQVPESGGTVRYTVRVDNTSAIYDSPMELTSLTDDKFGDLTDSTENPGTTCATGGFIVFDGFYECFFDQFISGTGAGSHTNTATAKAIDNEADEATNSNSATVQINDIPSAITLTKTANPTTVLETGDDPTVTRTVVYTLLFSVNPTTITGETAVDTVTFSSLTDDKFADWTVADCEVDMKGPIGDLSAITQSVPLDGFMLDPGEEASCTITEELTGKSGFIHTNEATINGADEDGQAVEAMNSATVTFTPSDPATEMKFAASMLVVLELHNAGIKNVNLTDLTLGGFSVFAGADETAFRLINTGGDFNSITYGACVEDQLLTFNSDVTDTDTYSCAFTIEFKPGLEDTLPIGFLEDVIAIVTDDKLATSTNDVTIQVITGE
ncbi:hypothetical protein [Moritella dasanensis]|uniref:hypothetical protein n=1 Tax=Moritella dasanensis TaxID=428031 RepID=UPI0002D29A20|nr:hypothetical protein [Moritella dasanensis]